MKTELDKCMAGEWYDCHDPIFITQKGKPANCWHAIMPCLTKRKNKTGSLERNVRQYR